MYNIIRLIFRLIFKTVFRWQIIGPENVPQTGGVIIAANHVSLWDPPLVGSALTREIHFMAKQELFCIPVIGWLTKKINAFPVKRDSADRNAIKHAVKILEEGKVLGVFPEGTRSKTGKLGEPEPGLALIAAKAGALVVPTAVIVPNLVGGKGNMLPCFKVIFGEPIVVERGKADAALPGLIMTKIQELLDSNLVRRS